MSEREPTKYDTMTPEGIIHDYVVNRGDIVDQYARDQMARTWRYQLGAVLAPIQELCQTAEDADTVMIPTEVLRLALDAAESAVPAQD